MPLCPNCGHRVPVAVPAEDARVLWDEYKHRHSLVWKLILQITTAVVILSVVPYLAPNKVRDVLEWWVLAAPVLAFVLGLFSIAVMNNELALLGNIRTAHRRLQRHMFGVLHEMPQKAKGRLGLFRVLGTFRALVTIYLSFLVGLSLINVVVCFKWWL